MPSLVVHTGREGGGTVLRHRPDARGTFRGPGAPLPAPAPTLVIDLCGQGLGGRREDRVWQTCRYSLVLPHLPVTSASQQG